MGRAPVTGKGWGRTRLRWSREWGSPACSPAGEFWESCTLSLQDGGGRSCSREGCLGGACLVKEFGGWVGSWVVGDSGWVNWSRRLEEKQRD
ncbi:hypothetical protein TIFTF001_024658 [Ficus carica]|uniref:Uncharacterized protein n=1 Tax=Ficus carica TaxID=3494 RepID=A0AA88DEZ0_FICCA|nr:hypothetical protein TIFTF001_024658 [Ficus carica]